MRLANSYGAETPFLRPDYLSDVILLQAVVHHAVRWCLQQEYPLIQFVVYTPAPFVQPGDLLSVPSLQTKGRFCVQLPLPIQRAIRIDQAGALPC